MVHADPPLVLWWTRPPYRSPCCAARAVRVHIAQSERGARADRHLIFRAAGRGPRVAACSRRVPPPTLHAVALMCASAIGQRRQYILMTNAPCFLVLDNAEIEHTPGQRLKRLHCCLRSPGRGPPGTVQLGVLLLQLKGRHPPALLPAARSTSSHRHIASVQPASPHAPLVLRRLLGCALLRRAAQHVQHVSCLTVRASPHVTRSTARSRATSTAPPGSSRTLAFRCRRHAGSPRSGLEELRQPAPACL